MGLEAQGGRSPPSFGVDGEVNQTRITGCLAYGPNSRTDKMGEKGGRVDDDRERQPEIISP